jgi:NO-binding membrane sensor protein with MHYT domain
MTGGYHSLLSDDYYTSGLLIRGIGFAITGLGVFLGLRCASRAHACAGTIRMRWLLLAGVSMGAVAIWATDLIAMLSLSIQGQTIRYSVQVTLLSLAGTVLVMCTGLLISGFRRLRTVSLIAGSVITGLGFAFTHSLGVAAIRMSAQLSYDRDVLALSAVIAILAAASVLWAATRLRGAWTAAGAAVIVAAMVTGMHEAGAAAVRLPPVTVPAGKAAGGGATAESFLLPLIIGLTVMLFLACAAIVLAPTEEAMRYDQALLERIRGRARTPLDVTPYRPVGSTRRYGSPPDSAPPWTLTDLRRPSAWR